jgi:hypothetical protein
MDGVFEAHGPLMLQGNLEQMDDVLPGLERTDFFHGLSFPDKRAVIIP